MEKIVWYHNYLKELVQCHGRCTFVITWIDSPNQRIDLRYAMRKKEM